MWTVRLSIVILIFSYTSAIHAAEWSEFAYEHVGTQIDDSSPTIALANADKPLNSGDLNLGFLERIDYGDEMNSDDRPLIRLSFRYSGGQWVPFNQVYTHDLSGDPLGREAIKRIEMQYSLIRLNWTAVFHGKTVGTVKNGAFLNKDTQYGMPRYRSIPLGILYRTNDLEIKKNEIPDYEVSQARYDGFGVRGVKRPIVLVTDKKDHDPDQWHRISVQNIPDDISQLILTYLKDQHEKEMLMLKEDKVSPKDVSISPIDKYTKNELRITEAWKSKTGSILYGIGYSRETVILTVSNDDPVNHKIFILAEHDKVPVFIHDQLELVDIGDYDGNGDSEFIFWTTKENRDGYILCWGRPLKKTSGKWSYH